jgi:hypothetical protein
MTVYKLTCDECEFMIIGASYRLCDDAAVRRHPHTTTTRTLNEDATEELIDMEVG